MLLTLLLSQTSVAQERIEGPRMAEVVRIVDGDTLDVRVKVWLGQTLTVRVRLDGIDAPERNRSCSFERRLAHLASRFVATEVRGRPVTLHAIRHGKYSGRVLARAVSADGRDIGQSLIAAGLAQRYGWRRECSRCSRAERCAAWKHVVRKHEGTPTLGAAAGATLPVNF